MPDPDLPPSVYQGLGWSPAADPSAAPPVPPPPGGPQDFGGLSPTIPQAMGWAPPPDTSPMAPDLPPTPTSLPSAQGQPAPIGPTSRPDFQVSPPAPNSAATRPSAPPPSTKPQTFDQGMQALQQREAGTEAAQTGAVQAGVDAQKQLHADQLGAYQQADKTVQANAQARQAETDSYNKAVATNQAKVDADRQQIDSWKFNRNKYMDELGVGGKVRWGIGMILAGVGQGMMRQGGANPVLEMLQQNIHDANAEQFKQRDALVEKLGFDRQSGMDAATYHATRQAEIDKQDGLAYTALGKQLEEAAVKSADPIAQANGLKEAANIRQMGDDRLKSFIQMKSEHDQKQQQIGIEGGQLAETRRHNMVQEGFEKYKEDQDAELRAAALDAKRSGKLSEDESKRALFIPGPDGKPIVARDSKGNPVLSAEAGKDRETIKAAEAYNTAVNSMVRGIQDHGGESGWFKSSDWQKMQSAYNGAIVNLHKIYGVESFRGEWTADMFKKIAGGGVDPTSFVYNAIPGLQQSKEQVNGQVNALLHSNGYDGPPVSWQDTSNPPAPVKTDEDKIASDALLNPKRGFDQKTGRLATEVGNLSSRGPLGPNETIDTRLKQEGGILPSVRQAMATWGAALNSPDLAIRRHYYQQLETIAQNSESPETAAYAQQLLDRARDEQMAATPGEATAPEVTRGSSGLPRSP